MPAPKFSFSPLTTKKEYGSNRLQISIAKCGSLNIPKFVRTYLGLMEEEMFYLWVGEDVTQRALGIKIDKIEGDPRERGRGWRIIKPRKTKNGYITCKTMVRKFIDKFPDLKFPIRLPLQKYNSALDGEIYYVEL